MTRIAPNLACLSFAALVGTAAPVFAHNFQLRYNAGGGWQPGIENTDFSISMSGNDATITLGLASDNYVAWTIYSTTPTTESIDEVFYNGSRTNLDVYITDETDEFYNDLISSAELLGAGCHDFNGVGGTAADVVSVIAVVTGDITDDTGTLNLHNVGVLRAGGDIEGNVSSDGVINTTPRDMALVHSGGTINGLIRMDSSSATIRNVIAGGTINATIDAGENLESVEAPAIDGDISVVGLLGRIETTSGGIGVTGEVEISCSGFINDPSSGIFAADGCEIDADITSDSIAEIVIDGDLVGVIDIAGDLAADLTVHGSVTGGGVMVTGNLESGVVLTIDDDVSNADIEFTGMLEADSEIVIGDELKNGSSIVVGDKMIEDSSITIGTGTTVTAIDATSWIEIGDEVEEDAEILLDGDLAGAVYLRDLVGLLSVEEDVTSTGLIVMDELEDTGTQAEILIKGFLEGQIIINQNDNGSDWLGKISASTYGIGPGEGGSEESPDYTLLSADLGGGAIGLVPFDLHTTDCDPVQYATVSEPAGGPALQSVRIRHYGPVFDNSASGMPVTVERKLAFYPVWVDVTDEFEAEVDTLTRDLIVSDADGGDLDGFECPALYRIKPVSGDLICDGTAELLADEVDVAAYTYQINVQCKADLSINGMVDEPDTAIWAQNPVDVNVDGLVDTQDLADILSSLE